MRLALPLALLSANLGLAAAGPAPSAPPGTFPVSIRVEADRPLGALRPIWRFFGADEPNYATMKNGRKLVGELGDLRPEEVYFRAHNLLTTGDGTPALKWGSTNAYSEDEDGDPNYDWTILDEIFDTYRSQGVHPYVEIGFMPKALSVHPEPYRHHWSPEASTARSSPAGPIRRKTMRSGASSSTNGRNTASKGTGRRRCEQWYWEVWNEANIPYWQGTPEEFFKLHDFAVDAVRRALPGARVGGPDCAGSGGALVARRSSSTACTAPTSPTGSRARRWTSFPSTPRARRNSSTATCAWASPTNCGRRTRVSAIIGSFPELKNTPDHHRRVRSRGLRRLRRAAARLPQRHDVLQLHRRELRPPAGPGGARRGESARARSPGRSSSRASRISPASASLATNGIDKPVLNVFRMFSRMGGQRVAATSSGEVPLDAILRDGVRGAPDVAALASLDDRRLCVLVWHYHDDDVPGPDAAVALTVDGLPADVTAARLTHYRIDATHSNAFAAWQRLGSPADADAGAVRGSRGSRPA